MTPPKKSLPEHLPTFKDHQKVTERISRLEVEQKHTIESQLQMQDSIKELTTSLNKLVTALEAEHLKIEMILRDEDTIQEFVNPVLTGLIVGLLLIAAHVLFGV